MKTKIDSTIVSELKWDHSSRPEFLNDYARKSETLESYQKFERLYEIAMNVIGDQSPWTALEVADIGCGTGTQSRLWAKKGHSVAGLDVSKSLLDLARERTKKANLYIEFFLGSATDLPWQDQSKDVCVVPMLLEHVKEWRSCLNEFIRILKPNGILILTTTNKLCPLQDEFNLPMYSWFPQSLKKLIEKISATRYPSIANHATYPAVNWFTYFQLEKILMAKGFVCFDRFDLMDVNQKSVLIRKALPFVRKILILRWLGHMLTPYTIIAARRVGPVGTS